MLNDFTESCLAQDLAARHCIRAVLGKLRNTGLPPGRAGDIELVLAEALNNIVEHAYSGRPDGRIWLRATVDTEELIIRLRDEGTPLPVDRMPVAHLIRPTTNRKDLPEGGFGWHLIRTLTSAVRYDRKSGYNLLSLTFRIGRGDGKALPGSGALP